MARSGALEPGLLAVLRVLVGIQTLLLVTNLGMIPLAQMVALPTGKMDGGAADRLVHLVIDSESVWFPVGFRTLLLGLGVFYVFWSRLVDRLGRWYLPLFLIYFAVATAVSHAVITRWMLGYLSEISFPSPPSLVLLGMENAWSLFITFLFGVVLVGWQYDMRRVAGYALFLSALEVVGVSPLFGLEGVLVLPIVAQIVPHFTIYLMVGYMITRMMGAQRAQRQALYEANLQLTQYAAAQEQLAISHERNRMARELHDTLAHSLSAVAVQLGAVDSAMTTAPDEARTILGKALAQTRSGLTETRRALHALRATPLEDLGLTLAIHNLAVTTAQRNGLTATVELPETTPNLPPVIEQGVYRIAQEAFANAARHAGASHLNVTLTCNGAVVLIVEDDGHGFDLASVNGDHMGLQLMRERAEMMGGTLDIVSAPGVGARVKLVVQ